jgi:predicted lipoprotein with Yx(FWY)xxD motif
VVGGARVRGRMSSVIVAGAALLLAACGASGGSPSPSAAPSAEAPSASAAGGAYEVDTATDATLGAILVGEDGKTLYIFKKDGGGKSACNGDCATKWPPFVLEADETVTAGDGVTGNLATIARDDGSMQVTYNGAPLYYFAADAAAGDVKGQGLNDVWFVATPSGSSGSESASPSGGDEYTRGGGGASATP